jgi:hypothetical protein
VTLTTTSSLTKRVITLVEFTSLSATATRTTSGAVEPTPMLYITATALITISALAIQTLDARGILVAHLILAQETIKLARSGLARFRKTSELQVQIYQVNGTCKPAHIMLICTVRKWRSLSSVCSKTHPGHRA